MVRFAGSAFYVDSGITLASVAMNRLMFGCDEFFNPVLIASDQLSLSTLMDLMLFRNASVLDLYGMYLCRYTPGNLHHEYEEKFS